MIGFVDCYSGVSGNMLLGAIVDAGVSVDELSSVLGGLAIAESFHLEAREVRKCGIRATEVTVVAPPGQHHRPFRTVEALVQSADLPAEVAARSLAILRSIATVEARIHGADVADVELHEVGAIDSIVDVVGSVAGFRLLGVSELYASSIPVAPSDIRASGHRLPGPAPATLAVLAEAHAPTRPFGEGHELVTPTGAAILSALARFEQPPMTIEKVGYGAGSAELPWPNVLRVWLGQPSPRGGGGRDGHVVLETNIDDMSPQLLAPVLETLMSAGALDVGFSPLMMKKGRPATTVTVIAPLDCEATLADVLLRETTTLGVRVYPVRRYEADRDAGDVVTPWGSVAVKLKILGGEVVAASPEYESVRTVAVAAGVPIAHVHAAAAAAALSLLTRNGA